MSAVEIAKTESPLEAKKKSEFSPYEDNGGSVVAYGGKDFCVVAADTRMNLGYAIPSRELVKLFQLTSRCVLAASGMAADVVALVKRLQIDLTWYKHHHGKEMPTKALAQYLSNTLYSKRFFPYYAFCILAGIDENGHGCCFEYDAVGSYQLLPYGSSGSAKTLIQPFLDSQLNLQHQQIKTRPEGFDVPLDDAKALVREAITAGTERDIHTGDWLDLWVIHANGTISKERFPLKFD